MGNLTEKSWDQTEKSSEVQGGRWIKRDKETGKQREDQDNTVFRAGDQDNFQEEMVITTWDFKRSAIMVSEKKTFLFIDYKIISSTSEYSTIRVVARRDISEVQYREDDEEVRGSLCV